MGANGRTRHAQVLPGGVSHGRVAILVGPPLQWIGTFLNLLTHLLIKFSFRVHGTALSLILPDQTVMTVGIALVLIQSIV